MPKLQNQKRPLSETRLTAAEIRTIIGTTGYPLEVRLMQAFHSAGMDPVINPRVHIDSASPTRELDLIAHLTTHTRKVRLTLRTLIEAKSMPVRGTFVGFPWRQPTTHELRSLRVRAGGLPSLLEGQGPLWDMCFRAGGIAESFDPLNTAPVCVQWSTILPKKRGDSEMVPGHDDAYWKGLDTIVRATSWRALQAANNTDWQPERPLLLFDYPTMVVATPTLYLFDATTRKLRRTDSIILLRPFEVADGRIETRLVDVITEKGIQRLISSYKAAMTRLEACMHIDAPQILAAAQIDFERRRGQ